MGAKEHSYTVPFEPAEEGGYVVLCPALRGVVTQGDTLEEARAMAADAIQLYLECTQEGGLEFPPDKAVAPGSLSEKVRVRLPS